MSVESTLQATAFVAVSAVRGTVVDVRFDEGVPRLEVTLKPYRSSQRTQPSRFVQPSIKASADWPLASEHGMRLVAAESARGWLDKTSETVRRQLSAVCREATTQVVLDIVVGSRPRRAFPASPPGV